MCIVSVMNTVFIALEEYIAKGQAVKERVQLYFVCVCMDYSHQHLSTYIMLRFFDSSTSKQSTHSHTPDGCMIHSVAVAMPRVYPNCEQID